MRRSHGFRVKTRRKLRKRVRQRGTIPVNKRLKTYEIGDKVAIDIEPSVVKGMPHPRFQGKCGNIIGMQGRAYLVQITDGKKKKILICGPEHIKKISP